VSAVRRDGWASGSGNVDSIRRGAKSLGWVEVANRRGDSPLTVLRPVEGSAAHPRSLSAVYGLGQQPLHTDGAHQPDPPDFIVLVSSRPSATATRLWTAKRGRGGNRQSASPPFAAFDHGMFLVNNGSDSFYAPARSSARYRFDPGCMTACDARAREVGDFFMSQLEHAATYEWTASDQVLVIDNQQALHARSAVIEGDTDRELVRVAFRAGTSK
jgi:hypothetical protein